MELRSVSESIVCSSNLPPRVVFTSAWVSPRVNSATPCGRGTTRTSQAMGRMSAGPRPSIRTRSSSDALAHELRPQVVKGALHLPGEPGEPFAALLDRGEGVERRLLVAVGVDELVAHLLLDRGDRVVALVLGADLHGLVEPRLRLRADLRRRAPSDPRAAGSSILGLPAFCTSSSWRSISFTTSAWPNLRASSISASDTPVGAALDHDERAAAAADDEIDVALRLLLGRRVHDELVLDAPHAHGRDRPLEGQRRDGERRRGSDEGRHVRRVLAVGRQHGRDDLRLVAVLLGEERPDRAVDEAADEHLAIREARFALEEAAGNLARRGGLLDEIHRQREEVDARSRGCRWPR